ncbi:MAG: hypothetical protein ABEI57_00660 [Halapricum sp.]
MVKLKAKIKRIARGVVYGTVLTAIGRIFAPIFQGITFVLLGTRPSIPGWKNETWGLTDMPVVIARRLGELVGRIIALLFGVSINVIEALTFTTPGPWDGVFYTLVLAGFGAAVARFLPVLIEAIPYAGGLMNAVLAAVPGGDD